MIVHKDIAQASPEWFALRSGKLTASHATEIGNNGSGLKTYVFELMAEAYSHADKEQFSNEHTDRGNELEPQAREIYELLHGVTVDQVTFIEFNEFIGCSPDGLIGEDGGLEIKCPSDTKYFKMVLDGTEKSIDSGYIWQVQMSLLLTGRKWWDLVFYNPNYEKSMLVYRILPDPEKFKKLEEGLVNGVAMIKEIRATYKK